MNHIDKKTVQELLSDLKECGLKPEEICKGFGNRISVRTYYRWLNGEVGQKQQKHVDALRKYHKRMMVKNHI